MCTDFWTLRSELRSPQQDPALQEGATVQAAVKTLGSTIAAFKLEGRGVGGGGGGGGRWQVYSIGSAIQQCSKV